MSAQPVHEVPTRAPLTPRNQQVYDLVAASSTRGVTDPEVQVALLLGHGTSSAALTRLHIDGLIERLAERRGKSSVYVLAGLVDGRETAPYRPNRNVRPGLEIAIEYLDSQMAALREEIAFEAATPSGADRVRVRQLRATLNYAMTWNTALAELLDGRRP